MVLKPLETKEKNSKKKKFPDDNPGLKPRSRELKKKIKKFFNRIAVSAYFYRFFS